MDEKENWYALMVSILRPVTPEQAFCLLDGKPKQMAAGKADVIDMIVFRKEGMSLSEIGRMFGIGAGAVLRRIQRYESKQEAVG